MYFRAFTVPAFALFAALLIADVEALIPRKSGVPHGIKSAFTRVLLAMLPLPYISSGWNAEPS